MRNPFRCFNSSPEVIRLTVMMYVRYPLSLRQVEDILFERGIDICHETIRFWWNRFGPMFANEIRKGRLHHRSFSRSVIVSISPAAIEPNGGTLHVTVPAAAGIHCETPAASSKVAPAGSVSVKAKGRPAHCGHGWSA